MGKGGRSGLVWVCCGGERTGGGRIGCLGGQIPALPSASSQSASGFKGNLEVGFPGPRRDEWNQEGPWLHRVCVPHFRREGGRHTGGMRARRQQFPPWRVGHEHWGGGNLLGLAFSTMTDKDPGQRGPEGLCSMSLTARGWARTRTLHL